MNNDKYALAKEWVDILWPRIKDKALSRIYENLIDEMQAEYTGDQLRKTVKLLKGEGNEEIREEILKDLSKDVFGLLQ